MSPTVFIISEDGDLVHWFDCSDHMREPSDIAISGTDFYVCDFKGHCVAVFSEMGLFKCRIGSEKVTCFPNGIDISDAGDVLVSISKPSKCSFLYHINYCVCRSVTLMVIDSTLPATTAMEFCNLSMNVLMSRYVLLFLSRIGYYYYYF